MTRIDSYGSDSGRRGAHARSLRIAGAMRGLIIAYGIGAYSLLRWLSGDAPREPISFGLGPLGLILLGLGLQAVRWVVLRLVARHERAHGIEGALSPVVVHAVDLLIDGVTVLLFAVATFQGAAGFATSI